MRKKSIADVDIEGRRVCLRVHLRLVPAAKAAFEQTMIEEREEEEKRQEEERAEKERLAKESKKKGKATK
jgi:hypothetical protein